jgi:hypothetical protein
MSKMPMLEAEGAPVVRAGATMLWANRQFPEQRMADTTIRAGEILTMAFLNSV